MWTKFGNCVHSVRPTMTRLNPFRCDFLNVLEDKHTQQFLGKIWTKFGRNLDILAVGQTSINASRILDPFSKFFMSSDKFSLIWKAKILHKIWKKFRQNLNKIWTEFGQNLDRIWTKFGNLGHSVRPATTRLDPFRCDLW